MNKLNPLLSGIPCPTLSQQVAHIEFQKDQLNLILGEMIATCLLNLERGTLTCSDPVFKQFIEARHNLRLQIMGECNVFKCTDSISELPKSNL